jgi:protoporphyrinogen oxidase
MDGNDASTEAEAVDGSEFDVVVLGAGISGLVSASILVDQGNARIAVVDEYGHVGGNHIDRTYGDYTFDVGSLIFQDDSPLLAHFPEILPHYTPIDPTWSRLNPQGVITTYPFSIRDDLVAAGPVECARILLSAARGRLLQRRLQNARDFARHWLGARLLHRSGLENYMERFCGLPADRIDLTFAEKRMLWIAEYASIPNLLRRLLTSLTRPAALRATNHQLARPREGFAHLYAPAVRRLTDAGVTFLLSTEVKSLRKEEGSFRLETGDRTLVADRVVSTIPIDHVRAMCGMSTADRLPTVTLISLFFSFSGNRGFASSILYNFAHDGAWKRLTMYSDFYGRVDGREYFGVEVIVDDTVADGASAEEDFRQHVVANGLFDGDLALEGSHTHPHAYPIYTEGAGERAEAAIAALRAFGVESLGRQGGFRYQPTARVSTQEAEAALRPG